MDQILPPKEAVHHVSIINTPAQKLEVATFFNNILAHGEDLSHNSVAIDEEGQLLKQPVVGVFLPECLPSAWIEELVFVTGLCELTDKPADVYITPVWV